MVAVDHDSQKGGPPLEGAYFYIVIICRRSGSGGFRESTSLFPNSDVSISVAVALHRLVTQKNRFLYRSFYIIFLIKKDI